MGQFSLEFQDRAFFERYQELSDKQIRFYLDLRRAARMAPEPAVIRNARQQVEAGEGVIGIEHVDFVMDFELLCEKGFILREHVGAQER